MVATIREGGMVVDATRDLIASNGFESGSEQQSVSSEISNPRDTMKDQQLSETASPSSIASEIPTIVVGKPVLQVTTPPLSPERRPTNTNTVETTSTVSQQQQQAIPQPSPSTSPITRGDHDILPRSIDGYYPQQQQPQQLGDQQNSNDSRKLFVGGLPKDVTAKEFYFYFSQFGEILDSFIVYDRVTGKPRGFGFVTFVNPAVCRQLLKIYERETAAGSISEDEVVGWNEDTDTIDESTSWLSRPLSTRLQMRGRFIELKIAQPRGDSYAAKTPAQQYIGSRPPTTQWNQQQQHPSVVPRYFQHRNNNYNERSRVDGEYTDDMNKIPATLSPTYHHQYQLPPQQQHPADRHYQQNRATGYGYANAPPLSRRQDEHLDGSLLKTPVTPAQAALDMAHHMIFYAQLLSTPSMVSNVNYEDMNYYQEEILRTEDTDSICGSTGKYYTPSQPPPRPCTPSLSVPDVIVSPSKNRSAGLSDVFKIGGGTFYPDTTLITSDMDANSSQSPI